MKLGIVILAFITVLLIPLQLNQTNKFIFFSLFLVLFIYLFWELFKTRTNKKNNEAHIDTQHIIYKQNNSISLSVVIIVYILFSIFLNINLIIPHIDKIYLFFIDCFILFFIYEQITNNYLKIKIENGSIVLTRPLRKWSVNYSNHNDYLKIDEAEWDKVIYSNSSSFTHYFFYKENVLVYYFDDYNSYSLPEKINTLFKQKQIIKKDYYFPKKIVNAFIEDHSDKVI